MHNTQPSLVLTNVKLILPGLAVPTSSGIFGGKKKSRFSLLIICHLSGKRLSLKWCGWKAENDATEAHIRVSAGKIGTWRRTRALWMGQLLLVVCDCSSPKELNVLERVFAHVTQLLATPLRAAARATLTQWHTFRTQGGGAKARSSDVTGEPLQRSRCTEREACDACPVDLPRAPCSLEVCGLLLYLSNYVLFPLSRESTETPKRRSFQHLPVWDAEMMSAPHVCGYI